MTYVAVSDEECRARINFPLRALHPEHNSTLYCCVKGCLTGALNKKRHLAVFVARCFFRRMIYYIHMELTENRQKLFEFLKAHKVMSLATYGDAIWATVVYYMVDSEFNVYFVSQDDTTHVKNLIKNPNVACAIADTHQEVSNKKIGAQIRGVATEITGVDKVKSILMMWQKLNPDVGSAIYNIKNVRGHVVHSSVFKIKPTLIRFLNEDLYGEQEAELFEF